LKSITVQLSTSRGPASGLTLEQTFEKDWNNVKPYVDGISVWFSGSTTGDLKTFVNWFDTNGR